MAASKLKNLVIVVLLLVNVFLMILVIPAQLESHRQTREADAKLAVLFEEADIEFLPDSVPQGLALRELRMTLDDRMRLTAAAAILGEGFQKEETERGPRYTAEAGFVQFYGTRFTAKLSLPAEKPEEFSRDLLERMGLKVYDLQSEERNGTVICTVRLNALGFPIADSPVTLSFENGHLTSMDGTFVAESALVRVGQTDTVSARNALVVFLGSRLSTGWMGSAIHAVTQGWYISRSSGSDNILCPIWYISTDTGDYLVNGITQAVFIGV